MSRGLRPVPSLRRSVRGGTITTSPRTPDGRDEQPVVDVQRSRVLTPAAAFAGTSQFLAPPTADEDEPVLQASDCGEVAMDRLRHPFAVEAEPAPRRTEAGTPS
jgi:hypothetical protein